VETNTFSGTKIAQADYDMVDLVYELNKVSDARCPPPPGACGCLPSLATACHPDMRCPVVRGALARQRRRCCGVAPWWRCVSPRELW
jgi:hypothetical protein